MQAAAKRTTSEVNFYISLQLLYGHQECFPPYIYMYHGIYEMGKACMVFLADLQRLLVPLSVVSLPYFWLNDLYCWSQSHIHSLKIFCV